MIEKTRFSPAALVTYPDRLAAELREPVFARRLFSAAVPFIRLRSVPSTPAIGKASRQTFAYLCLLMYVSNCTVPSAVTMSLRDNPDPSLSTSVSGLRPACRKKPLTTSMPASSEVSGGVAGGEGIEVTSPNVRRINSVYRFWLGLSVCAATVLNGGDCKFAMSTSDGELRYS